MMEIFFETVSNLLLSCIYIGGKTGPKRSLTVDVAELSILAGVSLVPCDIRVKITGAKLHSFNFWSGGPSPGGNKE